MMTRHQASCQTTSSPWGRHNGQTVIGRLRSTGRRWTCQRDSACRRARLLGPFEIVSRRRQLHSAAAIELELHLPIAAHGELDAAAAEQALAQMVHLVPGMIAVHLVFGHELAEGEVAG